MIVKAKGNMYDWVTHMHSHLAGKCLHDCKYCYVQTNPRGVSERWKGKIRLIESEFDVNYREGRIIFIEHMNDMFAKEVPDEWIHRILAHCKKYNGNKYVFQTKNPERILGLWQTTIFKADKLRELPFPEIDEIECLIGTTIETNLESSYAYIHSKAPSPTFRYYAMRELSKIYKTFVTIEPILDFSDELIQWIIDIKPTFVNIGADSKKCNLPEPSKKQLEALIKGIQDAGIIIKKKINLGRLLK